MVQKPFPKARQPKKVVKETPKSEPAPAGSQAGIVRQQLILNVFQHTFSDLLRSDTLGAALQEVKQALFNREFDKAFGNEANLEVYAARWSPTRALCYESVLRTIRPHLDSICLPDPPPGDDDGAATPGPQTLRVVAIGGGAAELAALGGFLRRTGGGGDDDDDDGGDRDSPLRGSILLLDSAPWAAVVARLRESLTTPPPLSRYASAAAREASRPAVAADRLSTAFEQVDVLALGRAGLSARVGGGGRPVLATLLFTLNELFTAGGVGKTAAFLLDLTSALPAGSLLLVVDSPGSYSEAEVGKQARRYPAQWLLDRVLLPTGDAPVVEGRRWTKLESCDSVWFRLSEALDYPIPLEDMRYQMHLYRVDGTDAESTESTD